MPAAGRKPRATTTVAPVPMGRDATGTADAEEKADVRLRPRSVAGAVVLQTAAAITSAPEAEIEIGTETVIGAVENDTPTESHVTAAGPEPDPSTKSTAASVRASAGTPAGAPTRGSGPSAQSRRDRALGNLFR